MAWDEIKRTIPEEGSLCLKNCGKCCVSSTPVEKSEAMEILGWLSMNVRPDDLARQFQHADAQPAACPFLKPDKSCLIYPVRPLVCRMFGHAVFDEIKQIPDRMRQRCPEGVPFTQIPAKDISNMMGEWSEAARNAHIRTGALRRAIVPLPEEV